MQLYQRYQHFAIIVLAVQNSKCGPNAVSAELLFLCCVFQAASHRLDSSLPSALLCLQSVLTIRTSGHCMGTFVIAIFSFCFGTKHLVCSVIFSVFL
jgi:hypothetical protein